MAGVYISQHEMMLRNNSNIIIMKDDTLVCHTDKSDCCHNQEGQLLWSFNGSTELQEFSNIQNGDGTVYITFSTINFGMFCCQIPDANENSMTVCIHSG